MSGGFLWSEVRRPGGVGADAFALRIEDEQIAYIDEEGDVLASSMAGARFVANDEFCDSFAGRGLRRRLYVARECGAALEEAGAAAELPQQVGGASAGRGVGCVVGELGRYVGPLSAER